MALSFNTASCNSLGEVLPEHQSICKDEMAEQVDPEVFQDRLWNMFNVQFPKALTLPQIDRIRWHLFPEVRINTGDQGNLFAEEPGEESVDTLVPDIIKVMDMQQELLARRLVSSYFMQHLAVRASAWPNTDQFRLLKAAVFCDQNELDQEIRRFEMKNSIKIVK